jgi:hypothetical protein
MSEMTTAQVKAHYIDKMGKTLGEPFHYLMQDAALLHLRWNEYVALFGAGPQRVAQLNRAAPGFFHLVQDSWWDDLLLGIARITDDRADVLSVVHLPKLAKVAIRDEVKAQLKRLLAAVVFARDNRNRSIAHRNLDLTLSRPAKPLAPTSRALMKGAMKELDALLYFVDNHYTGTGPTFYESLDMRGGSVSILDIVERGLKHRDQQFDRYRSPSS